MKITRLELFILHAPVTRGGIADSTHALTHWGAPGVAIHTDAGLIGYGFSGTHAHLATDRLITDCIVHSYGPLLIGQEIGRKSVLPRAKSAPFGRSCTSILRSTGWAAPASRIWRSAPSTSRSGT